MTAFASTSQPPRVGWHRWPLAFVLAFAVLPVHDAAAQVTYSGAVRTATGTYLFTERTTSVYVLSAVEIARGPFRVSGAVPLIYQSTPWISYLTVPVPSGGSQSAAVGEQIRKGAGRGSGTVLTGGPTTSQGARIVLPVESAVGRTGLGDVIVRASYQVTPADATTAVRLHGAYKPGLASATDGFGTGASDYGAGLTVAHLVGRHQLSAAVEAWNLGDMPDLPLNNTLSYRVAYDSYIRSNRWSVSGAFSGWTTILDDVDPPMDISVGVARHFSDTRRTIGATASFGLTDSSPDIAVSLDWRLQF